MLGHCRTLTGRGPLGDRSLIPIPPPRRQASQVKKMILIPGEG